MCLYFMCLINVLIFLTEKRRDAPNGKLLMIIDKKVFKLQFNSCRNVYHSCFQLWNDRQNLEIYCS